MSITIIIVLIILLLMTFIIFFLLKKEIDDINNKSKIYFLHKAQEYTDSINSHKRENVKLENKEEKQEKKENNNETVIYNIKKANYEIDNIFKVMKNIDDKFNINDTKTIEYFINNYVSENTNSIDRYNDLLKMKKLIDSYGVYNLITTDDKESKDKLLNELRLINEDIFLEYYSDKDEINYIDFENFLDYEMGNCDPTIYVYVGKKNTNYNKLNKRIKTIYKKNIYKGIKIKYLNKLYDYSI